MPDDARTLPATTASDIANITKPRLAYHPLLKERFDIDLAQWRALVDAVWPNAKTPEAVINAVSYCRARRLDPFKRPVHIVPVWSSVLSRMVETVWPGIGELRTTAFRTGLYAGRDDAEFGADKTMDLGGVAITFPEWCKVTVWRLDRNGERMAYPGPRVYWIESYATATRDTVAPNAMWKKRPRGQIEKCAEAAALRAGFPEEIGNDYTDDEMAGQVIDHEPRPVMGDYSANGRKAEPPREPRGRGRPPMGAARGETPAVKAPDAEVQGREEPQPPPEPQQEPQQEPAANDPAPPDEDEPYAFADQFGEVRDFADFSEAVATYGEALEAAAKDGQPALEACWSNGEGLRSTLREKGHGSAAEAIGRRYKDLEAQAAASAENSPGPSATGDDAEPADPRDQELRVPLTSTAQNWFQPARAKLREMTEQHRAPEDFHRWREIHGGELQRLKTEFRSWHTILEKIVTAGEQAALPA